MTPERIRTVEPEFIPPGKADQAATRAPVIKVTKPNLDNRLSEMQIAILAFITPFGGPKGDKIGHLPRTGDVVDGLGLLRDKKSFASVSRSLSRLRKSGKLVCYSPSINTRGNGLHWSVGHSGGRSA